MEVTLEFLKLTVPAGVVLYAMYTLAKLFLTKEFEQRMLEVKEKHSETILPIRLQAYERAVLFLERITPNNLIVRLNDGSYNVGQFQQILLKEIRDEYTHNLSQQVYMSDEAWNLVKNAMEDVIVVINNAASDLTGDTKSIELAKKIFEVMLERDRDVIADALSFIKDEIRQIF